MNKLLKLLASKNNLNRENNPSPEYEENNLYSLT